MVCSVPTPVVLAALLDSLVSKLRKRRPKEEELREGASAVKPPGASTLVAPPTLGWPIHVRSPVVASFLLPPRHGSG